MAAIAAVVALGAGGVGWWWLTRPPPAFTVEEGLRRFRATDVGQTAEPAASATTTTAATDATTSTDATAAPTGVARPRPGVYRYRTTGAERLEGPIDDTHRYPDTTVITVAAHPCGVTFEWRPLVTRAEIVELCWEPDGVSEASTRSEHEFFRIRETRTFTCDPRSLWLPVDLADPVAPHDDTPDDTPDATRTWSARCSDGATIAERAVALVDLVELDVGGETVEAVHVRAVDTLTGESDGTSTTEWWLRRTDALLVRAAYQTEVRNRSPIGDVTYREDVVLELLTLEPAS